MESRDLSDSDDYIELVIPSPSVSQEELAPLSGSILLQPRHPNGIEDQLLIRIATARRKQTPKANSNNRPTPLSSSSARGKAANLRDGWKTDSGRWRLCHDYQYTYTKRTRYPMASQYLHLHSTPSDLRELSYSRAPWRFLIKLRWYKTT
jgi:hypothetical protein